MARFLPIVAGAAFSFAGCAQLAGIDQTNGTNRKGNSLTVTRRSIGNTVVDARLDLTSADLQATYLVPTDTEEVFKPVIADKVLTDPTQSKWVQDLADPTPVEFTLPDEPTPVPRIFSFPSLDLSVLFASLEHPNRVPAPDTAMLTVTTVLDAPVVATDSFQAYTVGSWSQHLFTTPTVGAVQLGPITYAFNTSSSRSGRPQLDRLTLQDAFFVLRYSGAGLTGVAETSFDQTAGTDVPVIPKMTTIVQDQMLDVKVSPPTLAMRYTAVRPTVSTLTMNWSVTAAPGYLTSNEGPVLQKGTLALADVGVAVKYGNPFAGRGWHTVFTLQTFETRTYTPAGTTLPVTLFAEMDQFIEPSLVAPGFQVTEPAALPVLVAIDGKQLATDGQTIAAPSKFVEVTFLPENTNATLFNLQVFDLRPNAAATALEYHLVFAGMNNQATEHNEARFDIPPEIFQVGHTYTLRALCSYEGYPAIADGDFTNRQLPLSQSFLDSGVFTVTP